MDRKCRKCGCADVADDFSFGGSVAVLCNHCGERTIIGSGLEQVEFQQTPCPYCSGKSKIENTAKRTGGDVYRIHECLSDKCGKRFSSIERSGRHAARDEVFANYG